MIVRDEAHILERCLDSARPLIDALVVCDTGSRDGTYRIVIDGTPVITCEMTVGTESTASADGMVATAMRIVNAVPAVVAAPPGLVSSLDLPLTLPRDPFRRHEVTRTS